MSTELQLIQRRLEREQNARHQADILLEKKSLELWETNRQLKCTLEEKSKELQTLNDLSSALKDTSSELVDNLTLLNEYKKAIDYSTLVSITDKNGIITYVNDAFTEISGYSREELVGKPHNIIRHPDNSSRFFKKMWEKILHKVPWHGVIKNRSKQGTAYYVDTTITPILDHNGEIKNFLALRYDITKVIEQKQRINRQFTDRLTGLPNRIKLIDELEMGGYKAIGVLNIDGFQEINDLYGQMIGDELLRCVAIYLIEQNSKVGCNLYKLTADEFAMITKNPIDQKIFQDIIGDFVEKLDNHIFLIEGYEIHIHVTAGISYSRGIQMLGNAGMALKRAKLEKQPFKIFDESLQEKKRYAVNQAMLKELKNAISNDRVIPYFQPIFYNDTMQIAKYECLMRLVENDGSVISPDAFLKIAQKSRMYPQLTKIMIYKSFEMFKDKDIKFTINLSIYDIVDPEMCIYIFKMLAEYPKTKNVIFEITESEGISNYNLIKDFIVELKRYKVQVAIDDFGSGYSNFMHLLELNVDYIKIDGSIVKKIIEDSHSQVLIKAIVSVAKELDMKVIAEFVSNEAILNAVKALGVDQSQGLYLGKPSKNLLE